MSDSPAKAQRGVPSVLAADYVAEVRTPGGFPPEGAPEIAIAGRSNVGKSTLLNRLAARHALARTSKTPGRTRGIIFYDLQVRPNTGGDPVPLRLADLPGYGYAQVAKTERVGWGPLIEDYVKTRGTLALFLVLVDCRRGIDREEGQLLEWLVSLNVPVQIVVTKVDKLSAAERGLVREHCKAAYGEGLPPLVAVSGNTGEGLGSLWNNMLRAASQVTAPDPADAGPQAP